ncbi:hypothetical protein AZE42_04694 [Rhizopogon vesiculosus]|uniref:DOC domain-containing protein n=1 Tax=Rhizopogon vesiculosus TaxID=180088 RepID=A0A1J8Q256_9AGAM|nr:hypothetical protein AZE42_04694 [Rhizopogon vesiculosus]
MARYWTRLFRHANSVLAPNALDGNPDMFWQPSLCCDGVPSQGGNSEISIYLSWLQDDSYTLSTLAIRAGTGPSDLQDVRVASLEKLGGWITFNVSSEPDEDGDSFKPIHAYVLQVILVQNHEWERYPSTWARVLGPQEEDAPDGDHFPWNSLEFKMYERLQ